MSDHDYIKAEWRRDREEGTAIILSKAKVLEFSGFDLLFLF